MATYDPSQLMQLAQSLARSAPAQSAPPPDYTGEINGISRDYQLADALAGQGQNYIQDSGWLGALAQAVSGGLSYYKGKKADKAASEVSSKLRAEEQAQRQAEAQRQAQERASNIERLAASYGISPEQASVVADGLGKAADFKAPVSTSKRQFKDGLIFDPATGEVTQTPYYKPNGGGAAGGAQPKPPAKFGKDLDSLVAAGVITEDEAARQARVKAGIEVPPARSAAPKPLSAEARNKVALLNNAIENAKKYRDRTFGEGDEFRDIDSRLGDTPQLLKSAVQDSLYVKTGASAPAEEVAKAEGMYLPSSVLGVPTERDSTARAKVDNFINDMNAMRETILGGGQSAAPEGAAAQPAAQASSVPVAVNEATGERLEYRNGKWVKARQ